MPLTNTSDLHTRLLEVEESHTRLLNHLPGMAYRCTASQHYDYSMIFVSKGSKALLGLTPEEVMQSPTNIIEQMIAAADLSKVRNALRKAIKTKSSYDLYYSITTQDDIERWVWDQGEGVYDEAGNCIYLEGFMMDVTAHKVREQLLVRENKVLRASIVSTSSGVGKLIGKSQAMKGVYRQIIKAAESDTSVVIYGETGVGKDLVAKTIHTLSKVKGRYIPVNCGAIPETLLESEFFGHIKGAFSGATSNRSGYLAAADGGTLFLDEIGELPITLQVKLLRALESKTYTPVGSNEVKKSQFRLIAATNQNLQDMVKAKTMRADFFYRIHVLALTVPPLRERTEDIALLVAAYTEKRGATRPMTEQTMHMLQKYWWPGNVRELHNVLERYWTFGELALEEHAAFCPLPFPTEQTPVPLPIGSPSASPLLSLADARDDLERKRIVTALESHGWRKGTTAEALGITLRTLQRKVKKYAIVQ